MLNDGTTKRTRQLDETAAVLAREGNRQESEVARGLHRLDEVGRVTARADGERHVARLAQDPELIGEHLGEIAVVGDGRDQRLVGGERKRRQRLALLDDRVKELDGHVLRVGGASSVAHAVQPPAPREALRHDTDQRPASGRLDAEALPLDPRALARLAENGLLHEVTVA
jgi:hypothetical protein